jgi:hypothetical protein
MKSKTINVVYKGARDSQDYDDFTCNKIYLAQELTPGFILVLNDRGILVEMPTIDFDFNTNGYSRNWFAFCKHNNLKADHEPKELLSFINWINQKGREFREIKGLSKDQPIGHLESWVCFLENSPNKEQLTQAQVLYV